MAVHEGLARGRWHAMTLAEQLGNVGSEFERALAAKRKGLPERYARALERMLELLDLTREDPRWRGPRLRELCRLRESACETLEDAAPPAGSAEGLQRYFLAFAFAARNRRPA